MASASKSKASKLQRLASYRPILDRLVFGVALLGVLTAIHLYIQQGRGFDRGCLGFSAPQQVEATFDCNLVVQSDAGSLFGISNPILGLLFYASIAAISFATIFADAERLQRLKQSRALLIAGGFAYSMYLSYYQYFVLEELCALCLISASLATMLFVLLVIDLVNPIETMKSVDASRARLLPSKKAVREAVAFGSLAVLVVMLAGADLVYFNNLEDAPAVAQESTEQVAQAVRGAADPAGSGACTFNPEKDPIANFESLISFTDPAKGNPEAPVTVVEYFDPNCPHCKTMHPIMQETIAKYGDQARFVFKPIPIWQRSVVQVAALHAAAQVDKFFEMMDRQFELQQSNGLSLQQLKAIAGEIGMDPELMERRLRSGIYNSIIQQQRTKASEAGVTGVPAVIVDGRFVEGSSRSVECLGQFIEQAAQ